MEETRNADAILKKIETETQNLTRGKLKIFFGYAAGVGKTYAMLAAAQDERETGIDVVAGYIEPHAREETARQAVGLEQLPVRLVDEKSIVCREFDLDGALARKPAVILVDEMAHTNAAGSRHQKRYEDIKELLNAGIDVYTTLNVQHIESIHDVVAGITGVLVRERIPDSAFDRADQIEMVDIPPSELIARLNRGKIYKEERVGTALGNFFTLENLTALREIALRRMADWVNREQDSFAAKENMANSAEHIMMCLSPSPSNAKVIRQAARMANAFHGKFTAFYVETPDFTNMGQEDAKRLKDNMNLAEKLGANTVISYGDDIVEQIAEYARAARVTKIVLGRSYTKKPLFAIKESFSDRLAKIAPQLEIFLIPDAYAHKYVKKRHWDLKGGNSVPGKRMAPLSDLFVSGMIFILATGIALLFQEWGFGEANLIMVYVLGVILSALFSVYQVTGILYGIACIFAFNYFFTDPKYTFNVYDPGYLVTFFVMFVAAIIISSLMKRVKYAARANARKAYRMEILLETSQLLQQTQNAQEIADRTIRQLGKLLNCNVYCFIGNPEGNSRPLSYLVSGGWQQLPKEEQAVAAWTYKNNKHAGSGTSTLPGVKCLYLAVRNGNKVFAVVGIELPGASLPAFEKSVLSAILNESALAFEKDEMVGKEKEMAVRLEQEQLRANLLRSISHDLRTPLTSISGNADMLLKGSDVIAQDKKGKIYKDIYDDSMWLVNLVENLLSVTRIENGTIKLKQQPELIGDVITESLKHVSRNLAEHEIAVIQEDDMLIARMDVKLMMQVIINLVDNAVKYTQTGSRIEVAVTGKQEDIVVEVKDNGEGLTPEQKENIFTMFYTAGQKPADGRRGMGMGLALCKSIVEAHGGTIWVGDNSPVGTIFGFRIKAEEVTIHEQSEIADNGGRG